MESWVITFGCMDIKGAAFKLVSEDTKYTNTTQLKWICYSLLTPLIWNHRESFLHISNRPRGLIQQSTAKQPTNHFQFLQLLNGAVVTFWFLTNSEISIEKIYIILKIMRIFLMFKMWYSYFNQTNSTSIHTSKDCKCFSRWQHLFFRFHCKMCVYNYNPHDSRQKLYVSLHALKHKRFTWLLSFIAIEVLCGSVRSGWGIIHLMCNSYVQCKLQTVWKAESSD